MKDCVLEFQPQAHRRVPQFRPSPKSRICQSDHNFIFGKPVWMLFYVHSSVFQLSVEHRDE